MAIEESNTLIERMLCAIGPTGSIAHSVNLQRPDDLAVRLHKCSLVPNDHISLFGSRVSSGAAKLSREQCIIAAAGEALERYSLGIPLKPASRLAKFSILDVASDGLALDEIRDLQGLHEFQFSLPFCSLAEIEERTKFDWIEGERLIQGTDVLVPQEMVRLKREPSRHFEVTTNGCALAETKLQATLRASYELIERHNFMLFWWRKEDPTLVDFVESMDSFNPELKYAFGPWLQFVHVIYYPGPLNVPTFVSFFLSANSRSHPTFFVSAAADLNPRRALENTLQELGSILTTKLVRHFSGAHSRDRFKFNPDREFVDFRDHHEFYMYDHNKRFLHFLGDENFCKPRLKFSEIVNQCRGEDGLNLQTIRERFESNQHNPIVVDQTPRDVAELGLHVVRLMDSKIIDLNAAHAHRRWGKKCLYDGILKTPNQLNHWPHPFP